MRGLPPPAPSRASCAVTACGTGSPRTGSVSKVTLEGSQSQQLPGGINFFRLSPVELLGNLLGDKNIYICRGQTENRGLRRPGQVGEGLAFRGSCGSAGARCGCPPGGVLPFPLPQPSPPGPHFCPRGASWNPGPAARWLNLLQAGPCHPPKGTGLFPSPLWSPPRWGLAG